MLARAHQTSNDSFFLMNFHFLIEASLIVLAVCFDGKSTSKRVWYKQLENDT